MPGVGEDGAEGNATPEELTRFGASGPRRSRPRQLSCSQLSARVLSAADSTAYSLAAHDANSCRRSADGDPGSAA